MGGIADVYDVRENPDLKTFDHVVVGGSIRSGRVSQELQDYLTTNKDVLKDELFRLPDKSLALTGNAPAH